MDRLTAILRRAGDVVPYAILGVYLPLCVIALALFLDVYIGFALLLIVLASPAVGAAAIWCVPRWINHRDDPRQAKGPPDAP